MLRSTECGTLGLDDSDAPVTLAGWVDRRRDHGGIIFLDLRDRSGTVQVVANPELSAGAAQVGETLRQEWVVQVKGTVRQRPAGSENPAMSTGDIEVMADEITVLNRSLTPPFYISDDAGADEGLRLRYRYLDLRRQPMLDNLVLRHRVVKYIRDFLDSRGFLEIETPILLKSTPEGARDFLVPSRLQPGNFYALPQSPQQLKQLLMVAGVDKYFQIARCFRDEDMRADRQPEFTQLDLEMSFVEENDVLDLTEELYTGLVTAVAPGKKLATPFHRLSHAEGMERYASDKPDLRFGLEITDVTGLAAETEFRVFLTTAETGGTDQRVRGPGTGPLHYLPSAGIGGLGQGSGSRRAEPHSLPRRRSRRRAAGGRGAPVGGPEDAGRVARTPRWRDGSRPGGYGPVDGREGAGNQPLAERHADPHG